MKKQQFIDTLKKTLEKLKVEDIDDIVSEYVQHFEFKLADGFTEEEIAAKLGDPVAIATQYTPREQPLAKESGNKALVYGGLVPANIGAGLFFYFFIGWSVVLAAFSVLCAVAGFMMITNLNFSISTAPLIPSMPYGVGLALAFPLFFLSVLSMLGAIYSCMYIKQLFKAFIRWQRNIIAAAKGKPKLPSLSMHPRPKPKTKRILRNIMIITLIGFGITFIIGYAVAAITAKAFEFWHVWDWFQ